MKNFLAHVCHMEMYLQGPSRSGGGARFEESGYAVSALQVPFLASRHWVDVYTCSHYIKYII